MRSQGYPLLSFQHRLNLLIINILKLSIVPSHNPLNLPLVPHRQIPMKLVILTQHLYLALELIYSVLPLHKLLVIVVIVIILMLDVHW